MHKTQFKLHTVKSVHMQSFSYLPLPVMLFSLFYCPSGSYSLGHGCTASQQLCMSSAGISMMNMMMIRSSDSLQDPLVVIFICLLKQSSPGSFFNGLYITSKFTVFDIIYKYVLDTCSLFPLRLFLPDSEGCTTLTTRS